MRSICAHKIVPSGERRGGVASKKNEVNTLYRRFAIVAVACAALLGFPAATAYADSQISATIQRCSSGAPSGATATITGLDSAPSVITIDTTGTIYPASNSFNSSTGTDTATFTNLTASVRDGLADVPDGWSGGFTVKETGCKALSAPKVTADTSLCGLSPAIEASIRNPNQTAQTYSVSVSTLGTQTVEVSGGSTETLQFNGAKVGHAYTVTASAGGVSGKTSVTFDPCGTGSNGGGTSGGGSTPHPTPKPTPASNNGSGQHTAPTLKPMPSATPSASPSASGSTTEPQPSGAGPTVGYMIGGAAKTDKPRIGAATIKNWTLGAFGVGSALVGGGLVAIIALIVAARRRRRVAAVAPITVPIP